MDRARTGSLDRILLLSACVVECSLGVFLLALHRLGDRPLLGSVLSVTRLALLCAGVLGGAALSVVWRRVWRPEPFDRRSQVLTLLMNLATVGAILLMGEITVRGFSVADGDIRVFLGTPLIPRRWDEVAERYRKVLRERRIVGELSYLSYDANLGWSPTPSRTSDDGLFLSSAEGIRSPKAGLTLLRTPAPPGTPAPLRVALVGDSYTFGQDVRYEDTWGVQLEQLLGPCVEVRNFGVPGYGVDQAVLRYERDVRPWVPQIVILAPIGNDFERTMLVYIFLNFPSWDYPFSKPRFVLHEGALTLMNSPTIPPAAIFARPRVSDLPLVQYDIAFHPEVWERRAYDGSMLVRWLAARYPAWRTVPDSADDSMSQTAINRAVLRKFLAMARADGVVPILAYLPSTFELKAASSVPRIGATLIAEVAGEAGIIHTDLTPALRDVDPARLASRLGYGVHYSPEANRTVAEHLAGVVRTATGWTCLTGT